MAASHYDKTWVKLNAPWSKGFQNKSKPDCQRTHCDKW